MLLSSRSYHSLSSWGSQRLVAELRRSAPRCLGPSWFLGCSLCPPGFDLFRRSFSGFQLDADLRLIIRRESFLIQDLDFDEAIRDKIVNGVKQGSHRPTVELQVLRNAIAVFQDHLATLLEVPMEAVLESLSDGLSRRRPFLASYFWHDCPPKRSHESR